MIDLVSYDHPILHAPMPRFDFKNSNRSQVYSLGRTLVEALTVHGGIGLAANQIGLPWRMFVMHDGFFCVNPRIVNHGDEVETAEEYCLSYPGVKIQVPRYKVVQVRYFTEKGEAVNRTFQDLTARVFQHETDHLDGLTMLDRGTRLARERAEKKMVKYERSRPSYRIATAAADEAATARMPEIGPREDAPVRPTFAFT